jgi:predicted aspartyl protease
MTAMQLIFALLLSAAVEVRAADPPPDPDQANALFKAGKFAEADKIYAQIADHDPKNARAATRLGQIALLSNRLQRAQNWLEKALAINPDEAPAKALLAEVLYRQDDFRKAAPLLRAIGQDARAEKLASFNGVKPYRTDGDAASTSLKFVVTDPLPVVRVKVNGSEEVNFFIDTGAAEVVLDAEFAKQVGAKLFGSQTGSFAGGKKAQYEHGRIDSITLGDFVVKNVPVHVQSTRQFSKPVFGGRQVDGIIGTVLLYHFLSTLDYPKGELMLRRNTKENRERFAAAALADQSIVVPFWMAGDHFIVSWSKVEQSAPVLLFVDTGLAGGGVTLAESVLKEAGIQLREGQSGEGIGGGGKVKVTPFLVRELSLGEAKERNVVGLFTGPFPLENSLGFRIGGIISHGFFRPYALTFDFTGMQLLLLRGKKP